MKTHIHNRPATDLKYLIKTGELARLLDTRDESVIETKKRKRDSDSAYGSSIISEKKPANDKFLATQAENVAKKQVLASSGLKQEMDSPKALTEMFAGLESSIHVVSPDHVRQSKTLPLPFGHPKSRNWRQLLPSIKACTQAILGNGNGGAIELFCVDEVPTVCVTCWNPSKVDHNILVMCMKPLDLPIVITKGKVRRSMDDQCRNLNNTAFCGKSRFREARPPVNGHYMRRPDCGASLGVFEGPLSPWKVSLGGYLKLKHVNRADWVTYAMTVHHVLVEEGPNSQASSDESNDGDEDMIEAGYDYAPGVYDGVLPGAGDWAKKITFSSPAMPDLKDLISRLKSRLNKCRSSEQYANLDDIENLKSLLIELHHSDCAKFGHAAWSSGLTLAEGVEVRNEIL